MALTHALPLDDTRSRASNKSIARSGAVNRPAYLLAADVGMQATPIVRSGMTLVSNHSP